jgi:hypothetical protein
MHRYWHRNASGFRWRLGTKKAVEVFEESAYTCGDIVQDVTLLLCHNHYLSYTSACRTGQGLK